MQLVLYDGKQEWSDHLRKSSFLEGFDYEKSKNTFENVFGNRWRIKDFNSNRKY